MLARKKSQITDASIYTHTHKHKHSERKKERQNVNAGIRLKLAKKSERVNLPLFIPRLPCLSLCVFCVRERQRVNGVRKCRKADTERERNIEAFTRVQCEFHERVF